MSGYHWRHDERTHTKMRRLLWAIRDKVARTGSLLRPAGLNNRAADLISRIRWKLVRPYQVAPGTELIFRGQPAPHRIIVEVEEDKPPLPYNPAELPDYILEELRG